MRNTPPLVSVVIPCYNAARWIAETIASVVAQDYKPLEIVVVDDESTDETVDVIKQQGSVDTILRVPHGGAGRARNAGTAGARGEYIQYLDADDQLALGKVRKQIERLEATGRDVAYGNWQRLIETPGGTQRGAVVRRQVDEAGVDPAVALLMDFWCPPAAYMFRRRIVDRVGGWNERLSIIQDARFVLDCALHGAQFEYIDATMAFYRIHATSLSRSNRAVFLRECLESAVEVEAELTARGQIRGDHRLALAHVFRNVAQGSVAVDRALLSDACAELERVQPDHVDLIWNSIRLRLLVRWLGCRRALMVAALWRRVRGRSDFRRRGERSGSGSTVPA